VVRLQVRKKKSPSLKVGVYEEFPVLDDALEWLETYGGGKYFVKPLSLGKCKLGYYEVEGEDKESYMGDPSPPPPTCLCILIGLK
jgi:hypothetical protein